MDSWASLPARDRAIAGAALAAVALVGIGIGYVLPRGTVDEVAPQPVAGHSAPAAGREDQALRPELPVPLVDVPAPAAAPANADRRHAAPAPEALPAEAPEPVAAPVVDEVPAPPAALAPASPPAPPAEYAPTPPAPAAEPVAPPVAATYYANCTAVRAAGIAPILAGQPGYGTHLDKDQDGIGCDT